MDLAPELEAFWKELEAEPAEVLSEVEGLSQAQFDWRPAASEWSIGEVIHHLTLSEIATGKLTTTCKCRPGWAWPDRPLEASPAVSLAR